MTLSSSWVQSCSQAFICLTVNILFPQWLEPSVAIKIMVTKKIRTEYMKKFKDPKWETFSKCYEDSLKYRLTRRVMEHSHKPWFWEGWDSGSESSGWSTPRLTRNKVAPLSLPPPLQTTMEKDQRLGELKTSPGPKLSSEDGETEVAAGEAPVVDAAPAAGKELFVAITQQD